MPRHIHEIFEKETPCSSMDGPAPVLYITVQLAGRAGCSAMCAAAGIACVLHLTHTLQSEREK